MPNNYGSEFGNSGFGSDLSKEAESTSETKSSQSNVYDRYKSSSFAKDERFDASPSPSSAEEPASGIRGKVDELIEKIPTDFINKASEQFTSMKQDVSDRFASGQQWFNKLSSEKPMAVVGVALGAGVCVGVGAGVLISLLVRGRD
jgi:hypothetical protein